MAGRYENFLFLVLSEFFNKDENRRKKSKKSVTQSRERLSSHHPSTGLGKGSGRRGVEPSAPTKKMVNLPCKYK